MEVIHRGTNMDYLDANLKIDLIVNFWSNSAYSIGIFGGIEAGYHFLLDGSEIIPTSTGATSQDLTKTLPSRHSLDLSGRMGITTLLASHHRLDFTAKLPIGYVVARNQDKIILTPLPIKTSINVGYKYIF